MVDEADQASNAEEMHRTQALERVRREIAAGTVLETADECIDCGHMIPSARQAAVPGCQRCVYCAEVVERRHG